MSTEVKGTLANFQVRSIGDTDWKTLVCTSDSTFEITSELTKVKTNCGTKGAPSDPEFTASGNAIQNAEPTDAEVSYNNVKEYMKDGEKLQFRYLSFADAAAGLTEGEGFSNFGLGYFTSVSLSANADGSPVGFAWTFEGVDNLDDFDAS